MKPITQEDLDAALRKYRQAMMLRWIHPSQDEAAHELAKLYDCFRRQTEPKRRAAGPGKKEGTT